MFMWWYYTQWTTDQDILNACNKCGFKSVKAIKFYENRSNGQSKGFVCLSVCLSVYLSLFTSRALILASLWLNWPMRQQPNKLALSSMKCELQYCNHLRILLMQFCVTEKFMTSTPLWLMQWRLTYTSLSSSVNKVSELLLKIIPLISAYVTDYWLCWERITQKWLIIN